MNKQSGYYRFPTIGSNQVVFVCEDDLWSVSVNGGVAIRLTSNLGEVSHPFLSPDGTQLAFVGREDGDAEVYVMPAYGGVIKRLTFLGENIRVVGWSQDGNSIVFASNSAQPFGKIYNLYQINPQGGLPERLSVGLAHNISYGANGGVVLGRNTSDIARWKRYRGGTVGVLWIDAQGTGTFHKLIDLPGNLASPMWVGDRIYFISDHDGIGNLYSCTPDGYGLQQHTHSQEYYVRHATTDGQRIVYCAGAQLYYFDPATEENHPIAVDFRSPQVQRQRKFVDASAYLEDYSLHPDGHSTVVTSRGKSFWFGNWEGGVNQIGIPQGVRYRMTRWLNDKQRLVTISDQNDGVEALEIHSTDLNSPPERLEGLDLGRAVAIAVSPVADMVVLSNHRHELILVDLTSKESRILDRSNHGRIAGFTWSPDGKWVAYGFRENQKVSVIKICSVEDGSIHYLTAPRFSDFAPSFDPEGKYIYFLSYREFTPVYDSHYFDLNFPLGMRPYLITLKKDTPSPFILEPKPLVEKPKQDNGNKPPEAEKEDSGETKEPETSEEKKTPGMEIDFDGITHRVIAFPVEEGIYRQIKGVKGKVLFTAVPALDNTDNPGERNNKAVLVAYDFEKQKTDVVAREINSFKVAPDNETLIYRSGYRLRVCSVNSQNGKVDDEPGRKSGWLDLRRLRISIMPTLEWQQMLREAWRLQKEHFWVEDMSGVDWDRVYQRYRPLLDKVSTRSEFSDLIWELQGELGTSHAYERGGDYRRSPRYWLGFLGADFAYDAAVDAYRVTHIVRGDSWNESADSPLNRLGVNVQVGDILLAVNGQRVSRTCPPQELLVNQVNTEVSLTFAGETPHQYRTITVKTNYSETKARYREWVERNRQMVAQKTGGRVGYVHVPDMSAAGYAEFHRYYGVEAQKEGLIVDVRYNGGGHVSQLLLEKLSRRRIGYDISRWGKPEPYPSDSLSGPMVAITNEYAGSDGDIFSHCFKLMQLGQLIGKRTWGGVIGISPRHALVDGSVLTQPEYSFWFKDVGWNVENYGTAPDIEVEITPQDWAQGKDTQLDRAIELILAQLEKQPVTLPEFGDRPRLELPE
jgi:tricorn protease